jgi:hypothetical protein
VTWQVQPERGGPRPIEEQAVENCTVTTMERSGKSWIHCALPGSEGICADLRAPCRLDQVEELLLRRLMLQGPHV